MRILYNFPKLLIVALFLLQMDMIRSKLNVRLSRIRTNRIYRFWPLFLAACVCWYYFISVSVEGSIRRVREIEYHKLCLYVNAKHIVLLLRNSTGDIVLSGHIGTGIPGHIPYDVNFLPNDTLVLNFGDYASLRINKTTKRSCDLYTLEWTAGIMTVLEDEFVLWGSHWYGTTSIREQLWPNEKWNRKLAPFVSGNSFEGHYGGVQERYWLSSAGASVFVGYDVPLFVSMNHKNNGRLKLVAQFSNPYGNSLDKKLSLDYTLTVGDDMKTVHRIAPEEFWRKPTEIPATRMFQYPIWSTWAQFKYGINQTLILQFAKDINAHGFKNAQFEIDDDWSVHYGDFTFDRNKFPAAKEMVSELKKMGFQVTLWIPPFSSIFSNSLHLYDSQGMNIHVRWPYSNIPAITRWWDGLGALLDFTNKEATRHFVNKLTSLKSRYGIDSFKFDGGEATWLPWHYDTAVPLDNPNDFAKKFVEVAYQSDTELRCQEVRVGLATQHLPMFVRLLDKDSCWSHNNGLKSLIPHALTFGLIGYTFILPDMVGGNAYSKWYIGLTAWPERELYIRWLQASTLMPAMQFSVPPWHFDQEVINIAKTMCALHEKYSETFIQLAKESMQTGDPIIRPIWWLAPDDKQAQVIDSEFLVGDDTLVAPVLDQGARSRDIYLPSGDWRDELRGKIVKGGQWLNHYEADLSELPYFTRVQSG